MNDLTPMTDLPLHICVDTVLLRCFDALAQGAVVPDGLAGMWRTCLTVPASEDEMLVQGCSALGLSNSATMVLAILARIETDPRLARLVSACQSGDGDARPTPELLCRALGALETAVSVSDLVHGSLMRSGAVRPMPSKAPLAVTPLMLSAPMLWALGISPDAPLQAMESADVMPPQTYLEHAGGVASDPAPRCTVLRGGTAADQRLWAQAVAQSVGKTCVSLDQCYGEKEGHGDRIAGLGAALTFANGLPVETCKAAPGQRAKLIPLDGYTGPRLVLAGQDGGVEAGMWPVVDVSLPPLESRGAHGPLGHACTRVHRREIAIHWRGAAVRSCNAHAGGQQ